MLKRKRICVSAGYEQNQSHVFVNIEISQRIFDSLGEQDQLKGVLTLIDLAGYEGDGSVIGKESAENSMIQDDASIVSDKLNYTKMSDCGRLAKKVQVLGDIVDKSLFNSLRSFRAYVLGLQTKTNSPPAQKLNRSTTESDSTLVELISQNFKTDYRMFIVGNIDAMNTTSENLNKIVGTLSFCNSFKNIVGEFLAIQEDKRTKNDSMSHSESINNLQSILKELKTESPPPENRPAPVVPKVEVFQFPISDPNYENKETVRVVSRKPTDGIPDELVNKMVDLVQVSPIQDSSKYEIDIAEHINPDISKIPKIQSDRDNGPYESLEVEEKELVNQIKASIGEINQQINRVTPRKEKINEIFKEEKKDSPEYEKLLNVIKLNQSLNQSESKKKKEEQPEKEISDFTKKITTKSDEKQIVEPLKLQGTIDTREEIKTPVPKYHSELSSDPKDRQITASETSTIDPSTQLRIIGYQLAFQSMGHAKLAFKRLIKGCFKDKDSTEVCRICTSKRGPKIHMSDNSLDEPLTKHIFVSGNIFSSPTDSARSDPSSTNKHSENGASPKKIDSSNKITSETTFPKRNSRQDNGRVISEIPNIKGLNEVIHVNSKNESIKKTEEINKEIQTNKEIQKTATVWKNNDIVNI